MLKEAKKLYDQGLAIHWLRPKSKVPVESKWTTGPRKTWEYLEKTYRPGMNVGVRLGEASRLKDGSYLAVIDCDVKSEDRSHFLQMAEELGRILNRPPGVIKPWVLSGRGNGSQHHYIKSLEPIKSRRLMQSREKVKVKMPSVKPSSSELKELSEAEISQGIRLRAAWEVSLMGEGSQVALPPSIHPDSGGQYTWMVDFSLDLPALEFGNGPETKTQSKSKNISSQEHVAFKDIKLPIPGVDQSVVDLLTKGVGCEDRSASLYVVAIALVRAGLPDNEILSLLTDRRYFLGETGFDHAKTDDRGRAAAWVKRFTLDKARAENAPEIDFAEVGEETPLSEEAAEAQFKELVGDVDWRIRLEKTAKEGRVKITLRNIVAILKGALGENIFMWNEFSGTDVYGFDTPWGGKERQEITDRDVIAIRIWFGEKWRIEPEPNLINQAVAAIADGQSFHPVRDYLEGCTWDGVPRLDTWLRDYHNAQGPEPYLSCVSRKTLVAMVARVCRPGIKFDQVLILEGDQGVGKSTAIRTLAGDDWFTDAYLDLRSKDAALGLKSKWVFELGELSAMSHSDTESLKAFISTQSDYVRAPYGKRHHTQPRQCIFIGSTNKDTYLKDLTGNRRFWPVKVGQCDFEGLKKVRDQLLAEAKFCFDLGEPLYLEDTAALEQAKIEQWSKVFEDNWVEKIGEFLEKENLNFPVKCFTISDLFGESGCLQMFQPSKPEQMRAADALKVLGYSKSKKRLGSRSAWFWSKICSNLVGTNPNLEREVGTPKREGKTA